MNAGDAGSAAKPPWDGYGDDREAKLVIHDGDCDDLTNPSVESRNPDGAGVSSGGGSETRPHPAAADSAATVEVWRYVYAASLGLMVLSAVALTGYAIWLVAT